MKYAVVLVLAILCSCQRPDDHTAVSTYYSVDSLIAGQQQVLYEKEAKLRKMAFIGTDSSSADFQPDSLQWLDELNILKKADITNPALSGTYISEIVSDEHSNLTVLVLSSDLKNAEVKFIKLYYLDQISALRKVEALWVEKNPLSSSQKQMTLVFEDIRDDILLTQYKITGVQKMISQDTIDFQIVGNITF